MKSDQILVRWSRIRGLFKSSATRVEKFCKSPEDIELELMMKHMLIRNELNHIRVLKKIK